MNALLDLALAALPERAVIAKIAAQLIKSGSTNRDRGIKAATKAVVERFRPPHGRKTVWINTLVPREIDKQLPVNKRRRANHVIADIATPRSRRTTVMREAIKHLDLYISECFDVRIVDGLRVYLAAFARTGGYLGTEHGLFVADRSGNTRAYVLPTWASSAALREDITHAIRSLTGTAMTRAIVSGLQVGADFEKGRTVFYKDGKEVDSVAWTEYPIKAKRVIDAEES